ncbi:MAG: response regulator, partial [Planctomycetes bacterium]|nr:response regulator [Planctomycetota bacterium]
MTRHRQRLVLVVDRCPADRGLAREILAGSGYSVVQAGNPLAVLPMARFHQPDLIVLGTEARDTGESSIIGKLRKDTTTGETPILATGVSRLHDRIAVLLEAGADEYLVKPYDRREFTLRVALVLGVRRTQRTARSAQAALAHKVDTMTTLQRF